MNSPSAYFLPCYLAATFATAVAAAAPEFPNRPIRMLVSGVGGTGDFTARLVGPHLTNRLGQPVVVDNRPGGVIPGQILADAQPDGHTLMLAGAVIWLSPYMRKSVPFDPVRDFAPIMLTIQSPNVLVVHPSLPVKTVHDLIKLAKQKPGALNMASSGIGNSNHLAGAIFSAMAGVEFVSIAYKGAQLALNDVIGGRVHLMFATANASKGHIASGRLRAIGVTTAQPTRLMPDLPTIASAGLHGYESAATIGAFTRAGTPPAVIGLLHREIAEFLKRPETTERLFNAGVDVVASTPQEFAELIRTEMKVKGKIIKDAGIRMDWAAARALARPWGDENADLHSVLRIPETEQGLIELVMPPAPTTRDEFDQFIREEIARWAQVIKDAGIPKR